MLLIIRSNLVCDDNSLKLEDWSTVLDYFMTTDALLQYFTSLIVTLELKNGQYGTELSCLLTPTYSNGKDFKLSNFLCPPRSFASGK